MILNNNSSGWVTINSRNVGRGVIVEDEFEIEDEFRTPSPCNDSSVARSRVPGNINSSGGWALIKC